MRFGDHKASQSYNPDRDRACAHCMEPFQDGDEVARCALTDHLTHAVCVAHDV